MFSSSNVIIFIKFIDATAFKGVIISRLFYDPECTDCADLGMISDIIRYIISWLGPFFAFAQSVFVIVDVQVGVKWRENKEIKLNFCRNEIQFVQMLCPQINSSKDARYIEHASQSVPDRKFENQSMPDRKFENKSVPDMKKATKAYQIKICKAKLARYKICSQSMPIARYEICKPKDSRY